MDIQSVTSALAPAFIAGFAVQQAVEVVGSLISFKKDWDQNIKPKKAVLSFVAIAFSAAVVCATGLDVLRPFGSSTTTGPRHWIEALVTIVFISAGTEGFNSLMTWLSYKKEDAKASAAGNKNEKKTSLELLPS